MPIGNFLLHTHCRSSEGCFWPLLRSRPNGLGSFEVPLSSANFFPMSRQSFSKTKPQSFSKTKPRCPPERSGVSSRVPHPSFLRVRIFPSRTTHSVQAPLLSNSQKLNRTVIPNAVRDLLFSRRCTFGITEAARVLQVSGLARLRTTAQARVPQVPFFGTWVLGFLLLSFLLFVFGYRVLAISYRLIFVLAGLGFLLPSILARSPINYTSRKIKLSSRTK